MKYATIILSIAVIVFLILFITAITQNPKSTVKLQKKEGFYMPKPWEREGIDYVDEGYIYPDYRKLSPEEKELRKIREELERQRRKEKYGF